MHFCSCGWQHWSVAERIAEQKPESHNKAQRLASALAVKPRQASRYTRRRALTHIHINLFEARHRQAVRLRVRGYWLGRQGREANIMHQCSSCGHPPRNMQSARSFCPLRHMCQAPKWAHYQFMKETERSPDTTPVKAMKHVVSVGNKTCMCLNTAFQTTSNGNGKRCCLWETRASHTWHASPNGASSFTKAPLLRLRIHLL